MVVDRVLEGGIEQQTLAHKHDRSTHLHAQHSAPLKRIQSIPLPGLKEGDFDHFAIDLDGHRLFLTAEANGLWKCSIPKQTELIHTIRGLEAPHSLVFRADLKRLFVVDGDAFETSRSRFMR
jgi:hypothetical protein